MLELLDNVVYFPKSLDDLDGLFVPGRLYSVYACRASAQVYDKYPFAYVYEIETGKRLFSTTRFFRNILSSLNISDILEKSDGVLTYQAYPWCDDLRELGYRVCSISYLLYSALHNKFNQTKLLVDAARTSYPDSCRRLESHFIKKEEVFNTEVMFFRPDEYQKLAALHPRGFVVANSSSDGGSNVFRILNGDTYAGILHKLSSPVIRVESLINDVVPINQIGIVLENGWVLKYQPSVQLIDINLETGQFEYKGSNYALNDYGYSLKDTEIVQSTKLTDSIGKGLHAMGYRGIFGCDYLLSDKGSFFIELNPRYQASTRILSMAANRQRELSPHLLHIASFHDLSKLNLELLKTFRATDSLINLVRPNDTKGYYRVWDQKQSCDRRMTGNQVMEPRVHIGYDLL